MSTGTSLISANPVHLPSDGPRARRGGRVRRLHLSFGLTFPGKSVYLANYVPGQPLASDQDPRDMRHWWNQETGHHYELGLGSARLWKKAAHEAREGEYLDSTELNTATGLQEKVYYTHSDFGLTEAGGVRVRR